MKFINFKFFDLTLHIVVIISFLDRAEEILEGLKKPKGFTESVCGTAFSPCLET